MPLKRLYNPDLSLEEMLKTWPQLAPVFFRHKMLCVGCLVARFHTVQDACIAYGLCIDAFYDELARALNSPPSLRIV